MTNLSHTASFHSNERIAPSNRGIKHLANPLGRIRIEFTVPLGTNADAVERVVGDCLAKEPAILDDPTPSIFIDSITDQRIVFVCFAHVASPRTTYNARSNVLKMLLGRFRDEGIEIGTVVKPPETLTVQLRPLAAEQS